MTRDGKMSIRETKLQLGHLGVSIPDVSTHCTGQQQCTAHFKKKGFSKLSHKEMSNTRDQCLVSFFKIRQYSYASKNHTSFIVYNFMFYMLLKIILKIKDTLLPCKPLKTIMKVTEKPAIMVYSYNPSIQKNEAWDSGSLGTGLQKWLSG